MNNLTERNYIHQAPNIVNGRYSLTKSEGDLVYVLLTTIQQEDKDFKDYVFTKEELEKKLGVKIDTAQLRATAKSLMSKVLEVERSKEDWELFTWFSYFSYNNGLITCSFDARLKPYLLELKQYVLADIRHLVQIQSSYSRRIYLFLKEYEKFGNRKFNVEELQKILQVPKSMERYDNFKRKILNQAVKDISLYTDLELKNIGTKDKPLYFEEHKINRKVINITFHFKKNIADLKAFIEIIRELYTNQPLYENKEGRLLKCSTKGMLYYADDPLAWLDKKIAQKSWEWLHQNRERLLCFQHNLLDFTKEENDF